MLLARMGWLGVKQKFLPQTHTGALPLSTPNPESSFAGPGRGSGSDPCPLPLCWLSLPLPPSLGHARPTGLVKPSGREWVWAGGDYGASTSSPTPVCLCIAPQTFRNQTW